MLITAHVVCYAGSRIKCSRVFITFSDVFRPQYSWPTVSRCIWQCWLVLYIWRISSVLWHTLWSYVRATLRKSCQFGLSCRSWLSVAIKQLSLNFNRCVTAYVLSILREYTVCAIFLRHDKFLSEAYFCVQLFTLSCVYFWVKSKWEDVVVRRLACCCSHYPVVITFTCKTDRWIITVFIPVTGFLATTQKVAVLEHRQPTGWPRKVSHRYEKYRPIV